MEVVSKKIVFTFNIMAAENDAESVANSQPNFTHVI